MSKIVHLSDPHFGAEDPSLLAPLLDAIERIAPDLAVVSGDLTQRARPREFAAARDFLNLLPARRTICVPGNHDIPLHQPIERLLAPLARYRRFISPELEPFARLPGAAVLGIDTTRHLRWKSGGLKKRHLNLMRERFADSAQETRIVFGHHPFLLLHGRSWTVTGSRFLEILTAFAELNVDLVLSGHMHAAGSAQVLSSRPFSYKGVVVVEGGTCISKRLRGAPNTFNVIHVSGGRIDVAVLQEQNGSFGERDVRTFELEPERWRDLAH